MSLICPHCGRHFPSNGGGHKYDAHVLSCACKPGEPKTHWISPGYVLLTLGLASLATATTLLIKDIGNDAPLWLIAIGTLLTIFGGLELWDEKKG